MHLTTIIFLFFAPPKDQFSIALFGPNSILHTLREKKSSWFDVLGHVMSKTLALIVHLCDSGHNLVHVGSQAIDPCSSNFHEYNSLIEFNCMIKKKFVPLIKFSAKEKNRIHRQKKVEKT